ncbi:MAG: S9 family peptidase [Bacteroidales bacterium]|nr:S9 family peptidase [Bacteroidales bacterium]
MKRTSRVLSAVLITLFFIPLSLNAQKKNYSDLREALFSAGKLRTGGLPSNVTWIEGGEKYSFTRNKQSVQEIWTRDVSTGDEKMVFTNEDLTFPGTDRPFRYVSFDWTKDYSHLLFQCNFNPIWRYSGNSDYYIYSVDDKSLEPVVKQAFSAEISPDGKKVGYGKDGDLYEYDLVRSEHTQFTDDAREQVYNGRFGWAQEEEFGLVQGWSWSNDSRFISYWQSDETEVPVYKLTDFSGHHPEYMEVPYPKVGDNPPEVKIGVIDTEAGTKKWLDIDLEGGYVPRMYWTSEPNTLAVMWTNRVQSHMKIWFYDVVSGHRRLVMEEESDAWIDIFDFFAGNLHLVYFPDNLEEFFWISERDGWAHIYRYDYDGNVINQVTEGEWEVKGIEAIDVQSKRLYYVSTEIAPTEQNLFSVKFNGKGKKRLTKANGNHRVNVSDKGGYYFDTYSDVTTPSETVLMSSKGKMIEKFSDNSNVMSFLDSHFYAPREMFSFTTTDGQKLDGYFIKPADFDENKEYPLVLDIYGGPGSQGVFNNFGTSGWHQYLAQEGFVVASVNNRGNGGYGYEFEKIVHHQLGKWESHDFVETAKYLASKPWIDGDNMAIRGHSYGGYTSSYTMLTHPGVFKVSLTAAPVTDHLYYDCILTERYMGLIGDNAEGYKQSSVITHAANLEGHLLLAHSLMDENVHPQHTFQLVNALNMAGKDFDLKIYPPGAHGIATDMTTYVLLMTQYTDYLKEYLK